MATDTTAMAKPNGFKTVIDTIIAPKDAFEALRAAPTWVTALVVLIVVYLIGELLSREAQVHASQLMTQHMYAPGGMLSGASDDQKRKALAGAMNPPAWQTILNLVVSIVVMMIGLVINTVLLLLARALGRGDRGFATLWAASVNIAVPSQALAQLMIGIIARVRGADSFTSTFDLYRVLPGLGYIPGHGYFGAFLTFFNIFNVWGLVLAVMMLRTTARVQNPWAWLLPVVILFLGASVIGVFGLFPQ